MQSVAATPQADAGLEPFAKSMYRANLFDTIAVAAKVLLPTLAKGVIMRRPAVLALAERADMDRRAVRQMQRIRGKYGEAPLLLAIPKRRIALVLDPNDVHQVLNESPEPFAAATAEKTAALAHFEPKGVLISKGSERSDRRRFNEEVLETNHSVHRLAEKFVHVIYDEASRMSSLLFHAGGDLTWAKFSSAWFRAVRRILFGEAAAEDNELSSDMAALRSAANWGFLRPQRPELRAKLLNRIERYIGSADSGSLATIIRQTPATSTTAPAEQVPQWLFAFDAAGMATFRALALLASHRDFAAEVRDEITSTTSRFDLPKTRASVLESLRLWPTTPLLLRETTGEVVLGNSVLPAETAVVIFTPFFHRDNEHLSYADRFTPSLWNGSETSSREYPLIPFSEGPVVCPGRPLVLLLAPAMIAATLEYLKLKLESPQLPRPGGLLPGTLNHFGLRFAVRPRS